MTRPVYVALWHLDTRTALGRDRTPAERLLALSRKLLQANNYFQQLDTGEAGAIKIFAVPEYYFAHAGDRIRAYTADEKEIVKRGLRDISTQFPSVILCAGTVAWKEELDRNQRRKVASQLVSVAQRHANSAGAYGGEVNTAYDNIKTGGSITKSNSSTRWFGHCTAYIYCGGILVGELNKAANMGEFSGETDRVVMIPGYRSGKFSIPFVEGTEAGHKLTMGVEICADAGRLGSTFDERVDIHLLISATQIPQSPAARHGGLYLHCDSDKPPIVHRVLGLGAQPYHARLNPNPVADPTNHFVEKIPIDHGRQAIDDHDLFVCRAELDDKYVPAAEAAHA